MAKRLKSKRPDGRGHWPAGKPRNPDRGDWSRVRLALRNLLDKQHRRGVVSRKLLAEHVGVSDRQIRRYESGEDRPSLECQELIEEWISERRQYLRKTGLTRR